MSWLISIFLSAQIRQANANFSPFLSRYSPVIKYRIHDLFLPHPPLNHCVGGPDGNAGDNPGKGIHIEQPIEGAEAGSHGINPYQAENAGAENGGQSDSIFPYRRFGT